MRFRQKLRPAIVAVGGGNGGLLAFTVRPPFAAARAAMGRNVIEKHSNMEGGVSLNLLNGVEAKSLRAPSFAAARAAMGHNVIEKSSNLERGLVRIF